MRANVAPEKKLDKIFMGLADLQEYADARYPADHNLARWTWMILLRDRTFFDLMYPKCGIVGRQYDLEIRHATTHVAREEWTREADDVYELLSRPEMWEISLASLRSAHHRLYVHDEHWRCPDEVNHDNYRYMVPARYAEMHIAALTPLSERETWIDQARVQRINPCVYSLVTWWVTVHLSYLADAA